MTAFFGIPGFKSGRNHAGPRRSQADFTRISGFSSSGKTIILLLPCLLLTLLSAAVHQSTLNAQHAQPFHLLNEAIDISRDFRDFTNTYFLADELVSFDSATAGGMVRYQRAKYATGMAFNNLRAVLTPAAGDEFPGGVYAVNPELPFSIEFISSRTVRLRMQTLQSAVPSEDEESLMLDGPLPADLSWNYELADGEHRYTSLHGSVIVGINPFFVEFRDPDGKVLTRTRHLSDNRTTFFPAVPLSFVRRASDYSRSVAAVFSLFPGEGIYGLGESFTSLNKRGQRVNLWVDDAHGAENETMHKPISFFMSNRGYGMFMHTTTPVTADIGATFHETNALMIGDDQLDLFVFLGNPKEILDEYTNLTGKSPMPPLWSFGLWMSRITYFSEQEVRETAARLREYRIPTDVIHIDTGWFETDWMNDFRFAGSRFDDPGRMMRDLMENGFHISLWQLPYFAPGNRLFEEILSNGYAITDARGNVPNEDAIIDFSNPAAIEWYAGHMRDLLELGVSAIKVDFGEAAPVTGLYASGSTGFYEHNHYPLRYNKVVADVTREVRGENIIWARSAWAGSQRYPVHWGGDAANSDIAMASTLRGGLSLGVSGFSFWSHDIGGFVTGTPEELYRRWLPFGMLTSHSRTHGSPPKEPWYYGEDFTGAFRKGVELKYRLMPYVYAQAKHSSENGLPMVRALFIEYPGDPGSWLIEDQYLFGADILVAPLFEANTTGRHVYLPPGKWIDYQTGMVYSGGWHRIEAGSIPVIILVRDGAVIPHVALAQSTGDIDWTAIDLVVFSDDTDRATGKLCLPEDNVLHPITLEKRDGIFTPGADPLNGRVKFNVTQYSGYE